MDIERISRIADSMKDDNGKVIVNALMERLNSVSFWELLTDTVKIEIPIIQRDYAQGREDEKTRKIREQFLDSLIEAIESDKKSLELDFVYGDLKNGVFQPLDGQQRLTTLYLLYWYIALKSGNLSENKNQFKKFTYETRISSREFCNELVEKGGKLGEGESLSKRITDASWFFLSWGKDPTIKAMLVMLNSIELKLKDKPQEELNTLWKKLTSENPPITFHFKQINDVGLTDDLYIKMNARGKALTDFENFKAKFERHIKENEFEKDLALTESNKEQWTELTKKTFSHKIDTVWTDLFWRHRGDDNLVDNEFIKFIAGIAINSYAENKEIFKSEDEDQLTREILEEKKEKNITDEAVKKEPIERRITLLFNNPNEIIPEDFPTKTSFDYLKSCFDIYSHNKYDELKPEELELWDLLETKKVEINSEQELDNNLFINLVTATKPTYKQRVLFYAQTQFLLKVKIFDPESFTKWMRVCRNIVQNSTIDSAGSYIGAIGLIKELSTGCENIYKHLNEVPIKSDFASNQVKEEILKAKIIIKQPDSKSVIHKTEDTNFCKGKIRFPLYCADYENTDSVFNAKSLLNIQKVISEHLNNSDISNNFRRGLFTIKDNCFYNYWTSSYLFAVNAPKRCLIENVAELKNYAYNPNFRDYLKDILVRLTKVKLSDLIDDYVIPDIMPNWKKRIIKEAGLLDFSNRHFIALEEEKCCWLIPQSKVSNSKEGVKKLKQIK